MTNLTNKSKIANLPKRIKSPPKTMSPTQKC